MICGRVSRLILGHDHKISHLIGVHVKTQAAQLLVQ